MHSEINCIDHHHSTFLSPYPEKMGFDIGDGVIKHGHLLIRDTDIQHTVAKMAAIMVNRHVELNNLHFIINMRNGLMFGSDLLQRLAIPVTYDFILQQGDLGEATEYFFVDESRIKDKVCIVVQGPSNDKFYTNPIREKLESLGASEVQWCFCALAQHTVDIPVETLQYVGYLLQNLDNNRYLVGYGAGRRSKNQNVKALYTVEV